jgi:hypothetical protein
MAAGSGNARGMGSVLGRDLVGAARKLAAKKIGEAESSSSSASSLMKLPFRSCGLQCGFIADGLGWCVAVAV